MKSSKQLIFISSVLIILLNTGCQRMLPVIVWRPSDLFWFPLAYISLSYIFAWIMSGMDGTHSRKHYFFWNIVCTPVYGFWKIIKRIL